jgi:D-alanine--poly(phosphoribitol) ligase subunit 1
VFVLEKIKEYAATDRAALINREERLSYAELERLSNSFAEYLLRRYGDDRSPVVIYGHKETLILPCIYGALKAGRAYVPIDITVPADRVRQIAEDVQCRVAVDFYGLGLSGCDILLKDGLSDALHSGTGKPISDSLWVKGDEHAYILFTSGSSGKPKGVPITANNLENLHRELMPRMDIKAEPGVILNQISYSFDVSVVSVYMGISKGFTLYTIDKQMVENLGELFEFFEKSRLSYWVSTPSFAEMCIQSDRFRGDLMPELEKFLFCGEVLTHKLVDGLMARFAGAEIINTYGPTEATVLCTAVSVTKEMAADGLQIPIGYPLGEVTLRVADEAGEERPSREQGELLIISDNVGPGYYKRPDLTEKAFFTDEATGKRGYRTGDSCFEKDGLYYYCGRLDNQIKVNGFRVEIEDIENNMTRAENVSRAAVIPVDDGEKVQYLHAFVLLQRSDGLTQLKRATKIKNELKEFLPSYMIPRKIQAVESFPLNTNGKVDKKELRKLL